MHDRLVNAETLAAAAFEAAIEYGIEVETDYYGNGQDRDRYIVQPAKRRAKALLAAIPPDPRLDALLALYEAVGAAPAVRETPRQRKVLEAWNAARAALAAFESPDA